MTSQLEAAFGNAWSLAGNGMAPIPEYRFHPSRKWRFDFAFPSVLVAVECEGGTYRPGKSQAQGRHTTSAGFRGDCEKYNAAAVLGWRVLRFDARHLKRDPMGCVKQVIEAINHSLREG